MGVCFPTISLKAANECVGAWKNAGFMPLLMLNQIPGAKYPDGCGIIKKEMYEGYARECNLLCKILFEDARADVVVCAGDSIYPDPNVDAYAAGALFATKFPGGVGVMQPVYDKFEGSAGNCWSPWIGRNFWKEFYGGHGPFFFEYFQFAMGRELHDVAAKEGVYYETDAIHQHRRDIARSKEVEFYKANNRDSYWDKDNALYRERKAFGFEGCGAKSKLLLPKHHGSIILPSDL
jgi:hypothetical protein